MANNSEPSLGKILLWSFLALVVLVLVSYAFGWFGLFMDRPIQRYQEETRAQTYDTSRQARQGMNRDIARYCEQMRDESRPVSSRKAVAALIRTNADTFDGELTQDNKDCLSEARGM